MKQSCTSGASAHLHLLSFQAFIIESPPTSLPSHLPCPISATLLSVLYFNRARCPCLIFLYLRRYEP
ncbi:hypothetical protein N7468_003315 [Penicillium chermesinum]|uniref:Uncharacterized protein n=1 Tax=Penicillium chermesinum TaxID=63820 RepID=A0A9W9P680_9EURO|nr:uncharacterized protein N7468_003315 [Penicillium chermesinum]KAJ5238696.1 hypothetical protein N7468_003315 [Penicillium chermesinum]